MTVDAATSALLAQMREAGVKPFHQMTPEEAREYAASMRLQPPARPEMAAVEDRRVPVTGGAIPLRLLVPQNNPRGVIVYYHGGGWVIGSLDDYDLLGRHLAQRTGCAVALVDYRLAPEYRFPTAVDDCYAALCWMASALDEVAGPGAPLIVAGDSAGGNLAAVTALKARDRRQPPIAMQVLVYPVTDCDFETTTYRDPSNRLVLLPEDMIWFWDHYAPNPMDRRHPDASPLRATNLSKLPPAVVVTAEHDVLRDDGEIYATRLVKAGVPVEHRRFAGQMHGFLTMFDILPESTAALDYLSSAILRLLDGEPSPCLASVGR